MDDRQLHVGFGVLRNGDALVKTPRASLDMKIQLARRLVLVLLVDAHSPNRLA